MAFEADLPAGKGGRPGTGHSMDKGTRREECPVTEESGNSARGRLCFEVVALSSHSAGHWRMGVLKNHVEGVGLLSDPQHCHLGLLS